MQRVAETKSKITLFLLLLMIVVGLAFQSRYPTWHYIYLATVPLLVIFLTQSIEKIEWPKAVFLGLVIIVGLVMPVFFSKMPIMSLSWSYFLLVGGLLWLTLDNNFSHWIFRTLVIFCLVDVFYAFYQMLFLGHTRPDGFFMDPNVRAVYLLGSVLYVYQHTAFSIQPQVRRGGYTLLLVLLSGFHATQSRAIFALAVVAMMIVLLYYILNDRKNWHAFFMLVGISVLAFCLYFALYQFVPSNGLRIFNIPQGPDVRWEMWRVGWDMIKQYPVFGSGFFSFLYTYPSVRTELLTSGHFLHNDFLEYWLASGFPGLFLTVTPVLFFLFQLIKAFRYKNHGTLIYSGIGLLFLGFAFFNYFFWRVENLIVLGAVWRLSESESMLSHRLVVNWKWKFIVVIIVLLPLLTVVAKLNENVILSRGIQTNEDMHLWSDAVAGNESILLAPRSRWYFNNAISGLDGEIDYGNFAYLISQLDAEIVRGTLYPDIYCARSEIGYLLNEDRINLETFFKKGLKLDPRSIYCHYAKFNVDVAYGDTGAALENLKLFFSQRLSIQNVDNIIALARVGNETAFNAGEFDYVEFFSKYIKQVEQKQESLKF